MAEIDSKKLACVIARTLDEKLGKEITILNISNVSSLADYFVIVTGDSTPQVKALMNNTKERIKELFSRSPVRMTLKIAGICLITAMLSCIFFTKKNVKLMQ